MTVTIMTAVMRVVVMCGWLKTTAAHRQLLLLLQLETLLLLGRLLLALFILLLDRLLSQRASQPRCLSPGLTLGLKVSITWDPIPRHHHSHNMALLQQLLLPGFARPLPRAL